MENKETNNVIVALNNTAKNEAAKVLTLDAAWRQHGPQSEKGSYILGPKDQEELETKLVQLNWTRVSTFPGGEIWEAQFPQYAGLCGILGAVDAATLPIDAKVKIDLAEAGHPAAVLESHPGDSKYTNLLTVIVETAAEEDSDLAGTGLTGPVIATWFPGRATPPSKPDGVLKDGETVTVAEAMAHGFNTVKIPRVVSMCSTCGQKSPTRCMHCLTDNAWEPRDW